MKPEERLNEMGLEIPELPEPVASYLPGVKGGSFLFISGQLPADDEGIRYSGQVGTDVTVEEGYAAAQMCALRCLSVISAEVGELSKVKRVVKLTGFVSSGPDFVDHPKVVNGASDLLVEVFGDVGKHARAAVGMSSLPLGAAVEVEMIVEVD